MKTVAAIAFAFMALTMSAHSADSTVNFETAVEVSDNIALFDGRCATWGNQRVCAF